MNAISKRFTDNDASCLDILKACSVFNLKQFPVKEEAWNYGDAEVAALVDHFSPALDAAGVDSSRCEPQWSNLKTYILKRFEKPVEAEWSDVNLKLSGMCPNILALVDLVLTLPASSADAERGFNRLKITKSDWRSKPTDSHLTDQMMIMLESPNIRDYDTLKAIHSWNETPRRNKDKKEITKPTTIAMEITETGATGNQTPAAAMKDDDYEEYDDDYRGEVEELEAEEVEAKPLLNDRHELEAPAYSDLLHSISENAV